MKLSKYITIKKYLGNEVRWETDIELNGWHRKKVMMPDAEAAVLSVNRVKTPRGTQKIDIERFEIKFSATTDVSQVSAGMTIKIENWPKDNYVFAPGAAYNGNRYPVYPSKYPHIRCDSENFGPDSEEMVSDIPKLGDWSGRLQFHAGDMAAPFFGIAALPDKQGLLIHSPHKSDGIETGFFFDENMKSHAEISLMLPGVKEKVNYCCGSTTSPSEDKAVSLKKGDSMRLTAHLYTFSCKNIQALYNVFYFARKHHTSEDTYDLQMPFGSAWEILENKFNNEDWCEEYGYYSMGSREEYDKAWILGWPGIMMYPMLLNGDPNTIKRALRNIDYVIRVTRSPKGFFYASAGGDVCFGDHFHDRKLKNWLLVRRNCDALYYLLKCIQIIEQKNIDYDLANLKRAVKRCADAFVDLWERYGQIGQFIDADTGEIIIGRTTCGALSAGGLALCGKYFGEAKYTKAAEEIAEYYYVNYVSKGISNGGPGEILQAPDSESSYAMLMSYVTLYSVSGNKLWLLRSEEAARQFSSWCMPYNYDFPGSSEFGRLGMKTVGTVFANVQNKHSAPGICTHSGYELLRLFQYTGDISYLGLLKDIAGTIPQYLSVDGRLINNRRGGVLPHGWMHERVNTSDWEGSRNIGTVGIKNCWCSVSLMKTCAEIPGIYIQSDTGLCFVIDHIQAAYVQHDDISGILDISNPTKYDTEVTVLIEKKSSIQPDISIPALQYRKLMCGAYSSEKYEIQLQAGNVLVTGQ
ncbi:MAG: hypothetical protein PHG48_08290, partial [Eubacteriales bacterium]|nr:hypothetical protein [Eubacteriales bacterium]